MQKFTIIILLACVVFFVSCSKSGNEDLSSNNEPSVTNTETPHINLSQKAADFLNGFREITDSQQEEKAAQDKQKQEDESDRLLQITLNQTIDELLSKDPAKDAKRIEELIADLKDIGEKAVGTLKDMLAENRPVKDRVLLLRALGAFKTQDAGDELFRQAMNASEKDVQDAARLALKNTPAKDAMVGKTIEQIQTAERNSTDKSSPEGQLRAIAMLGTLGGDTSLAELNNILTTSDNDNVRKQAVIAIGEIGGDYSRQLLEDLFEHDDKTRVYAAQALGKMKQEDIVLNFGKVISGIDATPDMRLAAAEGLGADNSKLARTILIHSLKDARQEQAFHQRVIDLLISGLRDDSIGEAPLYVSIFDATTIDYLPQMMQPLLSTGNDYAAGQLYTHYESYTQLKKIHAVRTMARIQSGRSYDALSDLFQKETEPSLKCEILDAIKKFTGKEYAERTAALLRQVVGTSENKQERVTALKYLGEVAPAEASKKAEEWLTDTTLTDSEIFGASIDILKQFGDRKSKNTLLAFKMRHEGEGLDARIEEAIKVIEIRDRN
jgi:hypothetical protein